MLERLVLVLVLGASAALAYRLLRRWHVGRAARAAAQDPLLSGMRRGVPTIVYFTMPTCAPCRFQQRPALQRLQTELKGGVQVVEVDALAQPEAARRWGVFSVPTTFILDGNGQPREVNHGVAGPEKLRGQVERLSASSAAGD